MFEFKNVKYKDILDIPWLKIEKGKITTFVGQSGGGKTTVLRLLNKMISPTEGEIFFEGENLGEIDSVQHRRNVTMLSQSAVIFEGSIRDNLTIGMKYQDRSIPPDDILKKLLEQVHLKKELEDPAENLSGGERQRLSLARVLLLDSPVYLLDEPSSALDEGTERLIIEMIVNQVRDKGKTLVMVTHSQRVAREYSDVIVRIQNGSCSEEEK
ncbi:putative ABC transport system ATP-binding protein [Peptoclostridium litorale DSM 5388]|uniref:Phosphate import ATP-binding protein PstB 1 n=1 Tax=Peptoclostridium litorale DSM 5388 TaxID=1121324 RepID=A0A069RN75_PEPLI|nr:ABC transporter ATP-binding protein [Peptoclostridium litorale]KDR95602.1 phosphate import ATP-binding protein PstB 1 [Peptoclostridium litorale DSM 5388]SIN99189.1 putative ABC transport system ATP-binding protein [Peptoclostridium litorale DSM 5388]